LLILAAILAGAPAGAKLCGDDVGGQDVPCACGDVVASDLVLDDDPVVQTPCPSDGLIVRATEAPRGVTIDLRGKTLRGTGQGAGVWMLYGGPGGAHLVSTGGPAAIEGFRDGVVAHGADSAALIDGVVAVRSARDGVRVETSGYEIRNAEARDSGRDGFAVSGSGFRLSATRAVRSARTGFYVMGEDGTLGLVGAGLVADAGAGEGFNVMGMGHHLLDCVATGNAEDGVHLYGMHLEIRGCTATGNGADGISGMGMDWRVVGNQANDNDGNGILVGGMQVVDQGGNRGSGNRGLHQRRPPSQCEISGLPCLP
jgi:hypothetical protein